MNSTWRQVHSPDGRQYTLRARPLGIPDIRHGDPFWVLGWLWHWTVAKGSWKVDVTENVGVLRALKERQWRPPGWSTSRLASERAALLELERLARLIESGAWPGERAPRGSSGTARSGSRPSAPFG